MATKAQYVYFVLEVEIHFLDIQLYGFYLFLIETNKKEQKKRLNARMRRLVCPKSPLMVFSELYKDVPIVLQEQQTPGYTVYTASIEVRNILLKQKSLFYFLCIKYVILQNIQIDGHVYTGNHVSKTQAKQKACENFLRVMLAKKMNERPGSLKLYFQLYSETSIYEVE